MCVAFTLAVAAAGVLTSLASAILHSSKLLASCASSQSLAAFAALALWAQSDCKRKRV